MKISTKGRYALQIMMDLAINSNVKYKIMGMLHQCTNWVENQGRQLKIQEKK